mmetsp:Transcript_21537/g.52036  ORF Transcript_21537/g.52036 Transcript_21537/m.52036 type:complete len:275 (-) Transcript_21537:2527-3351(-)
MGEFVLLGNATACRRRLPDELGSHNRFIEYYHGQQCGCSDDGEHRSHERHPAQERHSEGVRCAPAGIIQRGCSGGRCGGSEPIAAGEGTRASSTAGAAIQRRECHPRAPPATGAGQRRPIRLPGRMADAAGGSGGRGIRHAAAVGEYGRADRAHPRRQNSPTVPPIDTTAKARRSEGRGRRPFEGQRRRQQSDDDVEHAQFGRHHREGRARAQGRARPGVFDLRVARGGHRGSRPGGGQRRRRRNGFRLGLVGEVHPYCGIRQMHDGTIAHGRN